MQIVLFGQNELASKLDQQPALKDRVALFGALTSLTIEDAKNIIRFRFQVARDKEPPFSDGAS